MVFEAFRGVLPGFLAVIYRLFALFGLGEGVRGAAELVSLQGGGFVVKLCEDEVLVELFSVKNCGRWPRGRPTHVPYRCQRYSKIIFDKYTTVQASELTCIERAKYM